MKKNILLTCFGGVRGYEFFLDFQKRDDIELFIADANPKSKVSLLTKQFIPVLPGDDKDFCANLLEQAKTKDIHMIIPGGDEEAFALMHEKKMFEEEGIIAAVQDNDLLPILRSKSGIYDYLKDKGFPVPDYRKIRTPEEFKQALDEFKYPERPLLIKPNFARGGRGIAILSERIIPNKDNLSLLDKQLCAGLLDGRIEYLIMDYIEGVVYDIDALRYKNGRRYFGIRKRFNNVTKLFSGNYFDRNEKILSFSEKLYEAIPTKYLIDYDLMVKDNGEIYLLEVNPRPSGSTISYLPFGINLYYIMAKSYLCDQHVDIDESFYGNAAVTFYKMMKGNG